MQAEAGAGEEGAEGDDGEGGWEMEDLEIPADVVAEAAQAATSSGPFTAPTAGQPASQKWLDRRTQLAAEHAAAGSFQSAMSLLHRQLAVSNFEPLRPYFMDLYTASHAVYGGVPGTPALLTHIERNHNGDAATQPPTSPTLLYTLPALEEQLKAAYKLVTEGKFTEALKVGA